jgi:hypothetical protein
MIHNRQPQVCSSVVNETEKAKKAADQQSILGIIILYSRKNNKQKDTKKSDTAGKFS